jgi:hypothetical protein
MNIDFKADAERLLYNADCESTLRLLDGFWDNHPEHQHKFYQSVCVEIANKSVTEYWEKLNDKFHRENPDWEPMDYEGQLAEQAEADFRQGQRDVERWREDKQLFCREFADRMYWRDEHE